MTFTFKPATREQVPVLLGLTGPSGGGKTRSGLRIAVGIQSVVGGEIAVIDTEARRALHYAEKCKFLHLDFQPPHGPERYLEAIEAAVKAGARVVMVDSTSHEHEGVGGVLEQHEAELDRMAGDDWRKRETCNLIAWAKPKAARRRFLNALMQMQCHFIFCFRAKEKVKPMKNPKTGKTEIVQLGWQPIAGDEFVYEMTDRLLLPPGANGVPDFSPEAWETGVPKITEDHRSIFAPGKQLDESIGVALAKWALGGAPRKAEEVDPTTGEVTKPGQVEPQPLPDATVQEWCEVMALQTSEAALNAKRDDAMRECQARGDRAAAERIAAAVKARRAELRTKAAGAAEKPAKAPGAAEEVDWATEVATEGTTA